MFWVSHGLKLLPCAGGAAQLGEAAVNWAVTCRGLTGTCICETAVPACFSLSLHTLLPAPSCGVHLLWRLQSVNSCIVQFLRDGAITCWGCRSGVISAVSFDYGFPSTRTCASWAFATRLFHNAVCTRIDVPLCVREAAPCLYAIDSLAKGDSADLRARLRSAACPVRCRTLLGSGCWFPEIPGLLGCARERCPASVHHRLLGSCKFC